MPPAVPEKWLDHLGLLPIDRQDLSIDNCQPRDRDRDKQSRQWCGTGARPKDRRKSRWFRLGGVRSGSEDRVLMYLDRYPLVDCEFSCFTHTTELLGLLHNIVKQDL